MARFQQIPPGVWNPNFRALDPASKVVYLYLLTCKHRNTEGLFELPQPHIATEAGLRLDVVAESMDELQAADLVEYDTFSEVVLLTEAMKHQPPKGKSQIDGAVKKISEVPETPLMNRFLDLAAIYAPELASRLDGVPTGSEHRPDTVSRGSGGSRDRGWGGDRERDRQIGVGIGSGTPSHEEACPHGDTCWDEGCPGYTGDDSELPEGWIQEEGEGQDFWGQGVELGAERTPEDHRSSRSAAVVAWDFQSHRARLSATEGDT